MTTNENLKEPDNRFHPDVSFTMNPQETRIKQRSKLTQTNFYIYVCITFQDGSTHMITCNMILTLKNVDFLTLNFVFVDGDDCIAHRKEVQQELGPI